MTRLRSLAALLLSFAAIGAARAAPASLAIGAAPSLGPAVAALNAAYAKQHPDQAFTVSVATTAALTAAVQAGNGAQLLLLDSREAADALVAARQAVAGSVTVFGEGLLAIYSNTPGVNTGRGAPLFIADYITGIALGDPASSPFGALARGAMQRLTVLESAEPKFRLFPDDAAAAAAVRSGQIDIGVLPVTLVVSTDTRKTGSSTALPLGLYTPAAYTAVISEAGRSSEAARAYLAFLMADSTAPLLRELGIAPPP